MPPVQHHFLFAYGSMHREHGSVHESQGVGKMSPAVTYCTQGNSIQLVQCSQGHVEQGRGRRGR